MEQPNVPSGGRILAMPETMADTTDQPAERSDWDVRSMSDPDFLAEKDACSEDIQQVAVPQNYEAEPREQMAVTMYKSMNIIYQDGNISHTFHWDARAPSEFFLREVKKHFRIPSAVHIK